MCQVAGSITYGRFHHNHYTNELFKLAVKKQKAAIRRRAHAFTAALRGAVTRGIQLNQKGHCLDGPDYFAVEPFGDWG